MVPHIQSNSLNCTRTDLPLRRRDFASIGWAEWLPSFYDHQQPLGWVGPESFWLWPSSTCFVLSMEKSRSACFFVTFAIRWTQSGSTRASWRRSSWVRSPACSSVAAALHRLPRPADQLLFPSCRWRCSRKLNAQVLATSTPPSEGVGMSCRKKTEW